MKSGIVHVAALLLSIVIAYSLMHAHVPKVEATPCNGPVPAGNCPIGQPHSDVFTYPGLDLQKINPVNQKAILPTHTVNYALVTKPGCVTGSIPQDISSAEASLSIALQFNLHRDDAHPDLIMFIDCGNEQIAKCGGVGIFCLPDNYPYNLNIYISDILSTYQQITRLSIILHELFHALATWNEQYCEGSEITGPCQGLPLFANTPGWVDIMNTGPNSRHDIGDTEKRRWVDTMYALSAPVDPCLPIGPNPDLLFYYPCEGRFYSQNLWSYELSSGIWYNPRNEPEWGECNTHDHDCWDIRLSVWIFKSKEPYDPKLGFLVPPVS